MAIDVSNFHLNNITDTCAVWNVLSSRRLFRASLDAGVVYVCTDVVVYECLLKPREITKDSDTELRSRFKDARESGSISVFSLSVDDLQVVELLEQRKRLGKGELSSIAFALKTRQAVLTDDQKARGLAASVLIGPGAQTTPHLLGWLFFHNHLSDSEKDVIVIEHVQLGRPLKKFFEEAYLEACRCRLMANQTATINV
jgi:hypothetical protein